MKRRLSDSDLEGLEQLARAASQELWSIGASRTETHEEAVAYVTKSIAASDVANLWMVFYGDEDPRVVCYTGNGPTSEANAFYLANVQPRNLLALIEDLRAAYAEIAQPKGDQA